MKPSPEPNDFPSVSMTVRDIDTLKAGPLLIGLVLSLLTGGWATAQVPPPLSYYDFEEASGVAVVDQGTAGNHGEIVDPSNTMLVRVVEGGIYAQDGEGRRCLQWVQEDAFGALAYVKIPYHSVLNSPDYTLSTWMRYGPSAPNWGYLFWAGGVTWPEPENDRHVDVWLNPTINGVDCILHAENEAQLRVSTSETDSGVAVMDGDWHLVTLTLETNRYYKIYLDGELAAEGGSETDVVENNGDDLWLGARPNDVDAVTSVKLVGFMDRVRIWDVALNAAQVAQLYGMEGPEGAAETVPAPEITGYDYASGQMVLTWSSVAGGTYAVERKSDLGSSWAPIAESLTGQAPTTSYTDSAAPAGQAYYRVVGYAPPRLFETSFEPGEDLSGWTEVITAGQTQWEVGAPTTGPESARTGVNVLATKLAGDYGTSQEVAYRSPIIDLTGRQSAVLQFYHYYEFEPVDQTSGEAYDWGEVNLLDATSGQNLLPGGAPALRFTDAFLNWRRTRYNLPAEALGKRIRIEFKLISDGFNAAPGWYIDDMWVD
jgi:hypothetical protein